MANKNVTELKEKVERKLREFEAMVKRKDYNGLEGRYHEDCYFLPEGKPVHQGRAGLSVLFKTVLQERKWDSLNIQADDVMTSGDLVTATGKFVTQSQDNEQSHRGKYVFVWKMIDGQLMLYYDIFNLEE